VLAGAFAISASRLAAQTPTHPDTGTGQWHFTAGLYGWFPAINGTITVLDFVQAPVDVSFSELWDHLKMNLTGHFEAQKGRFGGGIDAFYVRLGQDIPTPLPEDIDAEISMRQFIGEAFGFYKLVQGNGDNPWSLELLGGIRYWDTNVRLDSDLGDTDGKTASWVDGFGGLRVQIPIGSRLVVLGRGDVGAGGADLDWSASGDLALRLNYCWIIGAGYRTLDVDYSKKGQFGILDRTVWDIGYSGPRMWIVYAW
jgi:hypothetical protein